MDSFVEMLLNLIFNDPSKMGTMGLMMIITLLVLWITDRRDKEHRSEIKDLLEQYRKMNDDNRKDFMIIIQKYQEGQINVIQAINEIKLLLATIGAKL